MAQLLFDLGHRTARGREDFLVAPCNEVAVAWIDRWPEWPGAAFALYGPPGCGKTHLLQVWRAKSGALEIDPATLDETHLPEILGAQHRRQIEPVLRNFFPRPGFRWTYLGASQT